MKTRVHLRRSKRPPKPKRKDYYTFATFAESIGAESVNVQEALSDTHQKESNLAMKEEYNALMQKQTWKLCDPLEKRKILKSRWIFKIKSNPKNGSVRYKARLVVKGYEQIPGVDYHETFCPVVRFNTLCCLCAVTANRDDIDHLDVITAFLNGNLEEDIFIQQPEGFVKNGYEDKVCKLKKAIYGLKQETYARNKKLDQILCELGFRCSEVDRSQYNLRKGESIMYLTTYAVIFYCFQITEI